MSLTELSLLLASWDLVSERHYERCTVQNNLSSYEARGSTGNGRKEQELSRLQCPARRCRALEKYHSALTDAGRAVRNQGLGFHNAKQ